MTNEEILELMRAVNANRPQVTQTMNFYGSIGQQIAHVDRIEAHFDRDMKMEIAESEETVVKAPRELPELLNSEKAREVLKQLQAAGYLDEEFRPVGLSMAQTAVVAYQASEKIWGATKWKPWEEFWGMKNLKTYYQTAMSQRQTGGLLEGLRECLTPPPLPQGEGSKMPRKMGDGL